MVVVVDSVVVATVLVEDIVADHVVDVVVVLHAGLVPESHSVLSTCSLFSHSSPAC